ncbi:protein of unknown function [Candidatus Nitrospira inopinata]|uniref:Uncharacterized protein n=1 Tax=Candidatus Nitrospira inopinata TaxID=1715989 RepID=A0A0S4KTP1_9BACT|nr:protein of unknown function [Candidatus Nitrospira inopinata]
MSALPARKDPFFVPLNFSQDPSTDSFSPWMVALIERGQENPPGPCGYTLPRLRGDESIL